MFSWLDALSKKIRIYYAFTSPADGIKRLKYETKDRFGYVGNFSVSSKRVKVYSICEPVYYFEDIPLFGTELAKLVLLINNPPKGFRKITSIQLDETPPPLYATYWKGEGVYLDIKSCYYHLIKKFWGIKYARGQWLGLDKELSFWQVPDDIENILKQFKPIRNAIYGLMRAKVGIIWKTEEEKIKFEVRKFKNPLFYPDVPLAIMDITHAISTIAVEKFKAKYVAIDGFIIPDSSADSFKCFLEELGFKVGIKDKGLTIIKNFYTYAIGNTKTKTFEKYTETQNTLSNLLFSYDDAKEIIEKFKPLLLR